MKWTVYVGTVWLFAIAGTEALFTRSTAELGFTGSRHGLGLLGQKQLFDTTWAEGNFRLPSSLEPVSYNIHIVPVIDATGTTYDQWTAHGAVEIVVTCRETTKNVTLHKADIEILGEKPVQVLHGDQEVDIGSFESDEESHFWIIHLNEDLVESNNYVIKINHYVAQIRDTVTIPDGEPKLGFYRAVYNDSEGITHWLASTQFASIGFRRFCPGFDEPSFKAKFTLNVGRRASFSSFSNSEQEPGAKRDHPDLLPDGWVWDEYSETVKMSAYLLALVVASSFKRIEPQKNLYRLPIGIIGPEHLLERGGAEFAANESANIMEAFDDLFPDHLYPMQKMDSVAIPRDFFTFGAMENWGLVIYRDSRLFYYKGHTTEEVRQGIAAIISHELAHQWFGNTVTTKWWDNVWLNEGFASYFEFRGVHVTLPEFDILRQMSYRTVSYALKQDAKASSHPLINDATQQQVADMSIFDTITYDKGASLLRMMEGFLGWDNLIAGIKQYLEKKNFDSAVQDDLFLELDNIAAANGLLPSGKTVQGIMETWTLQKGFPLVRVQRGGPGQVFITQEKFQNNFNLPSAGASSKLDPNDLWEVPIAVANSSHPNFSPKPDYWIGKNTALKIIPQNTSQWIIVNPDFYGYYRVLYDRQLVRLIQAEIQKPGNPISAITKGQLVDDYFVFAKEGYSTYETAFAFLNFLNVPETDHAAWQPTLDALFILRGHLFGSNQNLSQNFAQYLLPKLELALDTSELGWEQIEGDKGVRVILRARLIDWACSLRSSACENVAATHFSNWMSADEADPDSKNPIPIDLRSTLNCAGVGSMSEDVFNFYLNKYVIKSEEKDLSSVPTDEELPPFVNGLGCIQNEAIIQAVLTNITKEDSPIKRKHIPPIIAKIGANSQVGRAAVYAFLRDSWRPFSKVMGGVEIIADIIDLLLRYQNTAADEDLVASVAEKIQLEDEEEYLKIKGRLDRAKVIVGMNIMWYNDYGASISQWLAEKNQMSNRI